MKVLLATNKMPANGCGVALYGQLLANALIANGIDITIWTPEHPIDPCVGFPWDCAPFDVVHVNYNMFVPSAALVKQHIPDTKLTSIFFHDVGLDWNINDDSRNHWYELVKSDPKVIGVYSAPFQRLFYFDMPVPDERARYIDSSSIDSSSNKNKPIIGHTGIRGDSLDKLKLLAENNNWIIAPSQKWTPNIEDEITRLAQCDVIVAHYNYAPQTGIGMGARVAIAAQRPLLIDHSYMNSTITNEPELYCNSNMRAGIIEMLEDIKNNKARIPVNLAKRLSWKTHVRSLIEEWGSHL